MNTDPCIITRSLKLKLFLTDGWENTIIQFKKFIIQWPYSGIGIPLTDLTSLHWCSCPKQGQWFQMPYIVVFVCVCGCVTDLRGFCVSVSLIWGERLFCLFHKKEVKYHLKCTSQELKRWFIILSWYLSNPTFPLVDDLHYIPI